MSLPKAVVVKGLELGCGSGTEQLLTLSEALGSFSNTTTTHTTHTHTLKKLEHSNVQTMSTISEPSIFSSVKLK